MHVTGRKDKETVEELSRASRHHATETIRNSKRDDKIKKIRGLFPQKEKQMSSLAKASAAATAAAGSGGASDMSPIYTMADGTQLFDAQGDPVTTSELQDMINQFAVQRGESYEDCRAFLCSHTNEQEFVNQFASLLSNPTEAWREQEQEISFSEDSTKEKIDGWDGDYEAV